MSIILTINQNEAGTTPIIITLLHNRHWNMFEGPTSHRESKAETKVKYEIPFSWSLNYYVVLVINLVCVEVIDKNSMHEDKFSYVSRRTIQKRWTQIDSLLDLEHIGSDIYIGNDASYRTIFQIIFAQPFCKQKYQLATKWLVSMHIPNKLQHQMLVFFHMKDRIIDTWANACFFFKWKIR